MYVPSAWEHMHEGEFVEPLSPSNKRAVIGAGKKKTRLFNNPTLSTAALRSLVKAHAGDLRAVPIADDAHKSEAAAIVEELKVGWAATIKMISSKRAMTFLQKRRRFEEADNRPDEDEKDDEVLGDFDFESFTTPETLHDLCMLGVAFRDFSGFCVSAVISELRALNDPMKPVLLAVDEYNCFLGESAFFYRDLPVTGDEMCIPRALQFLSKTRAETDAWSISNGMCVAAISHTYHEGRASTFRSEVRSVPLLIDVPRYSIGEYLAAIQYYVDNVCIPAEVPVRRVVAYRTFTASNPSDVRLAAGPYFNGDSLDIVGNIGDMAYVNGKGREGGDTYSDGYDEKEDGGGTGRAADFDDGSY